MITLDSEFIGSLVPPSKLTTGTTTGRLIVSPLYTLTDLPATYSGGTGSTRATEVPFARLSRAERLRVSGKADLTEEVDSDAESADGDENGGTRRKEDKEEREKRKMRGKGKSLKRYLRKQRKNVIDPTAVSVIVVFLTISLLYSFWFSLLIVSELFSSYSHTDVLSFSSLLFSSPFSDY